MYLVNEEQMSQIRAIFTMFKSSDFIIIFKSGEVIGYNNEISILKTTTISPGLFGDIDGVFITKSTASIKESTDFILADYGIILHKTQMPVFSSYKGYIELKYLKTLALGSYNSLFVYLETYGCISDLCYNPYVFEDLQYDETFQSKIIGIKASSGGVEYKGIDKFIMTLYTGVLPITKSDKVSLKIYHRNHDGVFISEYTIKKKTGVMKVYIKYLYL